MKDWILTSATAIVAVAGLAGAVSAAEPYSSPPVRSSPPRAQIFPAAHAWVNSMRQDAAAPAPARPAIVGHANIGQGGNEQAIVGDHGATIAATAWNGEHQYTGYVYSPGACDHTAPCVDNLWNGYCQRPHRCHLGHHFHRGCGMAMGCSTCNSGCDTGCGCKFGGHFGGCHGLRLHGMKHFGCSSCAAPVCAPACNTCSSGCGFGHGFGHLGHKCRGWFASLCNSCDGGMSCGCADGVESYGAPAGNNPEVVPTPAADAPMAPPPADDAKSARRNTFNRYLPVSFQ
jgi:hypothetical protein